MTPSGGDEMERARLARDRLASVLMDDPEVTLVDIGKHGSPARTFVRVHVHGNVSPDVPETVDGVPVVVVRGDYYLE